MSCHISALCIALPCPNKGLVETTLGRGIHGGWRRHPSSPFKAPTTPQPLPPLCSGRGTALRRAPSTSLSSFSLRRRSSALIPPQVYVGERATCRRRILRSGDLFSGPCGHTIAVSSMEDRITDQKMVLCCISCLLHSRS